MRGLKQHVGPGSSRMMIGTKTQNNLRINWPGGAIWKILVDAGAPLAGPAHGAKLPTETSDRVCSWLLMANGSVSHLERQYIGQANDRRLHKQGEVRRNKVERGGIDWAQSGIKCHVSSPTLFGVPKVGAARPCAVQQRHGTRLKDKEGG
jgi:hypothetical protein